MELTLGFAEPIPETLLMHLYTLTIAHNALFLRYFRETWQPRRTGVSGDRKVSSAKGPVLRGRTPNTLRARVGPDALALPPGRYGAAHLHLAGVSGAVH